MKTGAQIIRMQYPASIQDTGRTGVSAWGIPFGGVMDRDHAGQVNAWLDNDPNAAVLEFTIQGPELVFHKPGLIAISRGGFCPLLNGSRIEEGNVKFVQTGDTLKFEKSSKKRWGYLGVKGGFLTEKVFNSRSYYPGLNLPQLSKCDMLPYRACRPQKWSDRAGATPAYDDIEEDVFVRVYKGPEFDLLKTEDKRKIFSQHFTIGPASDRMAYHLLGETLLYPGGFSLNSSGVYPGVVQLLPNGRLLILMRDAQVTGGYPRILIIANVDFNRVAQKLSGGIVKFRLDK